MARTVAGGRYRLAPALDRLFDEIDQVWPARSKASDGWIGDTSHQARKSEHNPDGRGIVHAIDITTAGIDKARVLKALIGHPAVWYVINDGRIWSRTYGWKARRYTGANPHTKHIHVSIRLDTGAEAWVGRWLGVVRRPAVRDLRQGDRGADVAKWQKALGVKPDGVFGPRTAAAVDELKREHGWKRDGVIGPRIRKVLRPRLEA
jgi:peptidoglycan hydrolase-like protein with peptidoglycan-binding domain